MSKPLMSKIGLGTGSKIKIQACQTAFPTATISPHITAASGVKDQPMGKKETTLGARNRALEAMKQFHNDQNTKCDAYIGIENGIWDPSNDGSSGDIVEYAEKNRNQPDLSRATDKDPVWVDAAIVVMLIPIVVNQAEVIEIVVESDTIDLPPLGKRPFKKGRRGEWSELKDPHAVLTDGKKPREVFLIEALQRLSEKVKKM